MRTTVLAAVAMGLLLPACASGELATSTTDDRLSPVAVATDPPAPTTTTTPAPTPTRQAGQPAVAGADIDEVLAFLTGHGLVCERDLTPAGPHPDPDLTGALCSGRVVAGGPVLNIHIGYWPDGAIPWIDGGTCCNDEPVQPADRAAWLRWFAGIPYQGANPAAVEKWLLSNTVEACNHGCRLRVGSALWFHAVGSDYNDQIAVGTPP